MATLALLLAASAVLLALSPGRASRPPPLPCWLVREEGPGGGDGGAMPKAVTRRPAQLLLLSGGAQGQPPPPTSDPQPPLLLHVLDPDGTMEQSLGSLRSAPGSSPGSSPGSPAPSTCELSPYSPNPAAATWAAGLTPEPRCPRALDGAWLVAAIGGPGLRLTALLQAASDPWDPSARFLRATAVLTAATRSPTPRVRSGLDAPLDLAFSCWTPPGTPEEDPPALGLEWRRQHRGAGRLLLAVAPASHPGPAGGHSLAAEGAVAFAGWHGPGRSPGTWRGNGTLLLPAVAPAQEGNYLATVHLPFLQAQVVLRLHILQPPRVSLSPSPVVLDPLGLRPPEPRCLLSRFYPAEEVRVSWELRGAAGARPLGDGRPDSGRAWLSGLRHHRDGTVSLEGLLRPPPGPPAPRGAARLACRVRHPALPRAGLVVEVALHVAGSTGPSLDDCVGVFLTAFLLLGLIKALNWAACSVDRGLPKDQQQVL
ncbi:LOW QUALITY PROTEIN: tapasin [Tachyglossus aculeatus]|uniref:LOW QUALITY PROTEIN: tapasin n=1 Tax=Tachyglossus aculeatus TaxID=9261 RepID=UPI0018F4B36B|nr:LOW QUALITY PROTEIN: tapasin [Tachyglossus aculeatus]